MSPRTSLTTLLAAASLSAAALASALPAEASSGIETEEPMTVLSLTVENCDGCRVTATSALRSDYNDVWSGPERQVEDGKVDLLVPTERTQGLSLALDAPWEGDTGYQTVVALRYHGQRAGDRVPFREARSARRASGCWAGTEDDVTHMTIKVRRVQVAGNAGPAAGSIAWAVATQDHLAPMVRTPRGVLGTQDVFACGPS